MVLQNGATRLPRISLDRGPSEGTCRLGPQPLVRTFHVEKPGDIGEFVRHSVAWQRLKENFTIGHALEARIQQRKHATVRLRSNQTPKSLLQSQDRLRHLKFRKRVAPVFLKSAHSRRHDRVARHREWQPVYDDARS